MSFNVAVLKPIFILVIFAFNDEGVHCLSTVNGFKNYTIGLVGNFNILISAPHGGHLMPDDIANRTDSEPSVDTYTNEIAAIVRSELNHLFLNLNSVNAMPFLVFNNLHR